MSILNRHLTVAKHGFVVSACVHSSIASINRGQRLVGIASSSPRATSTLFDIVRKAPTILLHFQMLPHITRVEGELRWEGHRRTQAKRIPIQCWVQ